MLLTPGIAHSVGKCVEATAVSQPCEGILIPEEEATICLECFIERTKLMKTLDALKELHDEQLSRANEEIAIERRRADGLNLALIEATAPAPWYESPILWFSAGAGTVLIILLATR